MSKSPIFFVYIDLLLFFRNFSNFKEKLLRVELLSIYSSRKSASGYPRSIPPDLTFVQFWGLPWDLDHIMLCRWIWVAATMMLETMSSTSFLWHSLSPCCLGVWSSMKASSWVQDRCSTLSKPSNGEPITFSRRSRGRPKSGYRSEHSKLARAHFHSSIHRSSIIIIVACRPNTDFQQHHVLELTVLWRFWSQNADFPTVMIRSDAARWSSSSMLEKTWCRHLETLL